MTWQTLDGGDLSDYVDPSPKMIADERLREEISDFQHFLIHDLWALSNVGD